VELSNLLRGVRIFARTPGRETGAPVKRRPIPGIPTPKALQRKARSRGSALRVSAVHLHRFYAVGVAAHVKLRKTRPYAGESGA